MARIKRVEPFQVGRLVTLTQAIVNKLESQGWEPTKKGDCLLVPRGYMDPVSPWRIIENSGGVIKIWRYIDREVTLKVKPEHIKLHYELCLCAEYREGDHVCLNPMKLGLDVMSLLDDGKHAFKVGAVHHGRRGFEYLLWDNLNVLPGLWVNERHIKGTCAPYKPPVNWPISIKAA